MFRDTNKESRSAWEANADYWDTKMGDTSNYFHREIIRPHTEELLCVKPGDMVLDIACGNGNFSQRMAECGARVVAFDYSGKMIEHAKSRSTVYRDQIYFHVCDATNYSEMLALLSGRAFDKAVANMALMDISDIEPLLKALAGILPNKGIFVFSIHHPCFERPRDKYKTPCVYKGEAILGQPVLQNYYHRSLQDILAAAFGYGFVLDGLYEEYDDDPQFPVVMIVRLRKTAG